ncbi:hypothetical protein M5K25_004002 [Dendrobium thyrsiflorum]|uniref:DDE Tnp4 domain-containing protein n=1 Tax=Dendrobium thyrsiflorum TaxID=117978 RepID=A0ABD0VKG0_DENTH
MHVECLSDNESSNAIYLHKTAKSTKATEPTVNLEEYETPYFANAFMSANGVSYDIDGIPNSNLPDIVDDAPPSVDIDGSPMVRSKRSSDEPLKSTKRSKKKGGIDNLNELLVETNKNVVVFKETIQRTDPYTMTDCLAKLSQLENLTTQVLIALQDAFKENKDNKSIFMTWGGDVLTKWIEYIVSTHPLMSNYLCGVIPYVLCDLVDVQLHVNDVITELIASILEDDSSSDDELPLKRPMFDRTYTGHRYVLDVLVGHPGRAYQCFRLPPDAFVSLTNLLVSRGHLRNTKNMLAAEQLGIFLRGVAHAHNYRQLCEFFQHSLETVSRYFNMVLHALISFADEFINLPQGDVECHPFVRSNAQLYPYFKNTIGAIDGTHITVVVNNNLQNRYRNRKGFTSQNVMVAVSFDRQFVYLVGWEGSTANMHVLRWAVEKDQFAVPRNYYYLVDSDYTNTDKLIAPFRVYRYHLADYRRNTSRSYAVQQELFNHRHAQLRNVIERTFGIWNERFQVLTHMRQFPLTVQADLVIACAVLHNYIGRYHGHDMYFNMSQTEMEHDNECGEVDMSDEDLNLHTTIRERIQGEVVRHDIVTDIWNARVSIDLCILKISTLNTFYNTFMIFGFQMSSQRNRSC